MSDDLKTRILRNPFIDKLLGHQIDRAAFEDLRSAMLELAVAWRGRSMVEKDIAQDLYTTAMVMRNKVFQFREAGQTTIANTLEDMFIEIDRIINEECLGNAAR